MIIVDLLVVAVYCALIRFICPGCKKTFTYYPDFAIPYKHYTRQSIIGYAGAYVPILISNIKKNIFGD